MKKMIFPLIDADGDGGINSDEFAAHQAGRKAKMRQR